MAVFTYKRRDRYRDLDMEIIVRLNEFPRLNWTAKASIQAKGAPGDRERWRRDFWDWAKDRDLDAYSPRYGSHRQSRTSAFDCYLKSWQVVADFLVQWVGIEALSAAIGDAEEGQQRITENLGALTRSVQELTKEVSELRLANAIQQNALRHVGLAMVQLSGVSASPLLSKS
jgi:hypothetical protein